MSEPARHPTSSASSHGAHYHNRRELAGVSLTALGVVYGDIGTSPLYAIKECLTGTHGTAPTHDNVLGVLSLVFWALTLVICVKYLTFVLRADNKGEGGIQALAALVASTRNGSNRNRLAIPILLALFGTGLLYGEGVLTPAISVLGAVEGLEVATSSFEPVIIPITIGILVALFAVQRFGTHRIGGVFGWVMLVWFVSIGIAGVTWIVQAPEVLEAVNPVYAVKFVANNHLHGFLLLGSVVLVITGGEALYADMGHFGRTPIRLAWYTIVFPGLLLNYFGQGALMLVMPTDTVTNPFFQMFKGGPFLYPMVALSVMAAVIASQALISGAYSLTNQAVQLGYAPRVTIIHTSARAEGQIYIPEVNYLLMAACVATVLLFGSSTALAGAYGVAVTGTMAITSYLYFLVRKDLWKKPMLASVAMLVFFLAIDLTFFSSTLAKIHHGGWLPLSFGAVVFIAMTTWWRGRLEMSKVMDQGTLPDELFLEDAETVALHRVRGTAVFMTSNPGGIPNVLMHHVKHNQVLHQQTVLLSIHTESVPWVGSDASLTVRDLGHGFWRVVARVGFMQTPNVPRILKRCARHGLEADAATTTYYLGRQTLLTTGRSGMAKWRKMLFAFLGRNARPPTDFFALPPGRVVELGVQIEL
ncbi:MAG: potassium transporter Kup [Kofleriaceae bacterium]|nr:MAG: potassium transporter Kup [Kofleriaceae bacterium]